MDLGLSPTGLVKPICIEAIPVIGTSATTHRLQRPGVHPARTLCELPTSPDSCATQKHVSDANTIEPSSLPAQRRSDTQPNL